MGYLAQQHPTPQAQTCLAAILEGHSLAAASTWMDEIRSDNAYDYTST